MQEVAGTIVGIHDPAITMAGQQDAGFLTDKVAGQNLHQPLAQHHLNLAIDLGLVPGASRPPRSHQFRRDQPSGFQHQGDHRIEQGAIDVLASERFR
ncbi:hypothetical protein D9M69_600280 [compost metagenome]